MGIELPLEWEPGVELYAESLEAAFAPYSDKLYGSAGGNLRRSGLAAHGYAGGGLHSMAAMLEPSAWTCCESLSDEFLSAKSCADTQLQPHGSGEAAVTPLQGHLEAAVTASRVSQIPRVLSMETAVTTSLVAQRGSRGS